LNRERKKLAKFYEEVGNLIKEGDVTLLELAQKNKMIAIIIARHTVVKTSLRDAANRVQGILGKPLLKK